MEPRKFSRSNNKFISGVCAGLAESMGMDAWIMRALWIVFTVFTYFWLGVLAYLVLAFVMPSPTGEPRERAWKEVSGRNAAIVVAIFLICAGVLIIAGSLIGFLMKYLFPVGLIIGGGLLLAFAVGRKGGSGTGNGSGTGTGTGA